MFKKVFTLLLICFLIITGMVAYQWFSYKKIKSSEIIVQDEPLQYNVSLFHKQEGKITIVQQVKNLKQDAFLLHVNKNINNLTCAFTSDQSCNIVEEGDVKKVVMNGEDQITIEYDVTYDPKLNSSWFNDWFIQFLSFEREPISANFIVTLSEEINKNFTWAAGALRKASIDREHLNYYAWEKDLTTNFPLYLSKISLNRAEIDNRLSIFNGTPELQKSFNPWVEKLPQNTGLTLVYTENSSSENAPLLTVTNKNIPSEENSRLILESLLLHLKPPETSDIYWMWSSLPSLILEKEVGVGKAKAIAHELLGQLPKEIRANFVSWLLNEEDKNQRIDASKFDEILSSLYGNETQFFYRNQNSEDPTVPLYFIDKRDIFIENQQDSKEWKAIIRDGELHFPLYETAAEFKFEITELIKGDTYLLNKGTSSWRLFLNEEYFILNEENYGLSGEPLKMIDQKLYMSEALYENILDIEVIKREGKIYLRE